MSFQGLHVQQAALQWSCESRSHACKHALADCLEGLGESAPLVPLQGSDSYLPTAKGCSGPSKLLTTEKKTA